jgi:ABC-type multidrug transport system fused ATPase/permease subunit
MKKSLSSSHFLLSLLVETFREHKKSVVILVLSLMTLSISQSLLIVLAGPFIQILLSSKTSTITLLDLFPHKDMIFASTLAGFTLEIKQLSILLPLLLVAFAFGRGLASYFYQISVGDLALYVCKKYRDRLFLAIVKMPYLKGKEKTSAQWMSLLMNDVIYLQNRLLDVVNACLRDSVTMLACLGTLFFIHWPIAVLLLAISPFVGRGVGGVGEKISLYAKEFQEKMGLIADYILELRKRFLFIRAQQGEALEEQRFHEINNAYYQDVKKSILIRASFAPCIELMGFVSFSLIIWLATRANIEWFHPSNLFVFFGALGAFLKPLRNLGEQLGRFKETTGALQGSLPILLYPPFETKIPISGKTIQLPVVIESASFRMAEGKGIEAFGLELSPGCAIALVGASGGGKSTLLRGLSGLISPIKWESQCEWSLLADDTTYVSQEPFLFNDSVAENLQYGNNLFTNKKDSSLLRMSLRKVHLEAEVDQFPEKLEEEPLHINISGGQRQRLVLARSLLQQKKIMLWDEATSSIDPNMEKEILMEVIQHIKNENKILLAATHRVDTLPLFDQVWFVKEGKVALKGVHQELLLDPTYREFFEKK